MPRKTDLAGRIRRVWENHASQIEMAGDYLYVWQFEIRWAADLLRKQGRLRGAKESVRGMWELM